MDNQKSNVVQEEDAILPGQHLVSRVYEGKTMQIAVTVVIFLNYFISVVNAQILPEDKGMRTAILLFDVSEIFFNIIFTLELLLNLYANFVLRFLCNAWNLFDVCIVLVSWMSMGADLPGITVLRLFRAFRVFRLFKRVPSLRKIIVGVLKSLPGVSNAIIILILVSGMWSIMGVQFFGDDFPDEFGYFSRGLLTCMQIMTFDSWVSGITRPTIVWRDDGLKRFLVALYFVSYVFFSTIIMTNVLVSILVDKYTEAVADLDAEDEDPAVEVSPEISNLISGVQANISERVNSIKTTIRLHYAVQKPKERKKTKLPFQDKVANAFNGANAQIFMALIIFTNFFVNAVEAELKPLPGSSGETVFWNIDLCFNILYLVELITNMYANHFFRFWRNYWNWIDIGIVFISWFSIIMADTTGSGSIAVLRLFRAFRRIIIAFRVVRTLRLHWVKMIVVGIMRSLPGVANAFVLLTLIMGIWSIIGVEFFRDPAPRGVQHSEYYYSHFSMAMLTCLQIMSFDSWSSGITRPILVDPKNKDLGLPPLGKARDMVHAVYFITYVFVSAIIMSNVVLAILIDKFLSTAKEMELDMKGDDTVVHPAAECLNRLAREVAEIEMMLAAPLEIIEAARAKEEEQPLLTPTRAAQAASDGDAPDVANQDAVPGAGLPGGPAPQQLGRDYREGLLPGQREPLQPPG